MQTTRFPTPSPPSLALMSAFGFVSGLPLLLSGSTLRQWMAEGQVDLAVIGLTANVGLPYALKFLWAPLLDHASPPGPLARLGRRRGWLLAVQPLLALAIAVLALSSPATGPLLSVAAAGAIALLSATQDIAIDAWRIESYPEHLQGKANAVYVWGYRVAMLVAGSGVIFFAGPLGWHAALLAMAALALVACAVTLVAPEPPAPIRLGPPPRHRLRRAVIVPLREFLSRPGAGWILAYVALFNLGEAMAGIMLNPLYRSLGFERAAVAAIGPYSLVATMAGIGAGGLLVARGLPRAMIITGFLQMAVMALYVLLTQSPGDHVTLYATVVVEAFAQGLATAAFLTFLSGLCSREHTATQFALLTSIAPVASHTLGGFSGFVAAAIGWPAFYTLAMLASLPAMLIMLKILSDDRVFTRAPWSPSRTPPDSAPATPGSVPAPPA